MHLPLIQWPPEVPGVLRLAGVREGGAEEYQYKEEVEWLSMSC